MGEDGRVIHHHTHDLTFTETTVRKRFVSWDAGEAEREWAMVDLLAHSAPGLAPKPLHCELENGAPVIVMERVSGSPIVDSRLTAPQVAQLGRSLRRLWEVPVAAAVELGIGERGYGPTSQKATMLDWLVKPHDLDGCQDPQLVAEAIDASVGWLMATNLPNAALTVVGIADLNPANVLWSGTSCRLVDFEDGGLTDPAYDFADHTEHLARRDLIDTDALSDAIGLSEEESARVTVYRPLWASFWLAMLLPGQGGWDRNPPGTTETQARRLLALAT